MSRAILALALTAPAAAHARPVELPPACRGAIARALPDWQFMAAPPDAARWARARGMNPAVTRGDLDADGHADHAALVTSNSVPYLAVCISRGPAVELLWVEKPHCSDVVFLSKAGKRLYNFETGRHETLAHDGVSVSCFEKAGATYVYEKGALRRIVDSD